MNDDDLEFVLMCLFRLAIDPPTNRMVSAAQEEYNSSTFHAWLDTEKPVVAKELQAISAQSPTVASSLMGRQRWMARVHIVRSVQQMLYNWAEKCTKCGCTVTGDNTATPDHTLCLSCAHQQMPAPAAAELYELFSDLFPEHVLPARLFEKMDDYVRREMAVWLDGVLKLDEKAVVPAVIRQHASKVGPTRDGRTAVAVETVEVSQEGKLPEHPHGHSPAQQAFDKAFEKLRLAQADLAAYETTHGKDHPVTTAAAQEVEAAESVAMAAKREMEAAKP